jgi:hypothetical protein
MCTRARLVQADQTSEWLGMTHGGEQAPINVTLEPNTPAYVEISIDPAAHGPAGAGPWTRMVALKTATGQEVEFTVQAMVTQ